MNNMRRLLYAMGLAMAGCTNSEVAGESPSEVSGDLVASMSAVQPMKWAMTWTLLDSANAYVLVGSDASTNPYSGDTLTSNALPVLCINKRNIPSPAAIGGPSRTPGGAWRRTWSGGTVALTAPIQGTSLTSKATADMFCASHFGAGYRMAEFHDGDPALWSGWDFWGAALNGDISPFRGTRFWVSINDQNANPW